MLHEFEEIIGFHAYASKHFQDQAYRKDSIVRLRSSFPSAETVAIMIAEEFVLIASVLGFAIWSGNFELVLAVTIVNLLHLCVHLAGSLRAKRMQPGSWTATATAVVTAGLLVCTIPTLSLSVPRLFAHVVFIGLVVVVNLQLLTRNAGRIERWRLTLF